MKIVQFRTIGKSASAVTIRRGFTTPAVAIAMIIAMAGLALIIDRLWLDAADLELTTAAEAAALAAANELVGDDQLTATPDPAMRQAMALSSAALIASRNLVAGSPVVLDVSEQGDVRFGELVLDQESGLVQFLETESNPTTAVVTATRTRRNNNPVGLFMAGVTGVPVGDVATRVEATVDNRIIGVRPVDTIPVPALPMAIWWQDPVGLRNDTWNVQIELRRGGDNYAYDPVSHTVSTGQDGIPEIVLHSQTNGQQMTDANAVIVDIGTNLNDQELGRQITSGWTSNDLNAFGGEFLLMPGTTVTLAASAQLRNGDRVGLESLIGQPRICLLYSTLTPNGTSQTGQVICTQLVCIRILKVTDQQNAGCEVVVQPCVIKTRTAIINEMSPYYTAAQTSTGPGTSNATSITPPGNTSSSNSTTTSTTPPNPYIYKIRLTH